MGGVAFLKVGGIIGAVLFTFGLLTVVHYALKLYTGTAGFFDVREWRSWRDLFVIIIGNAIGCSAVAYVVHNAIPDLIQVSQSIVEKRLAIGNFGCFLLAICCGFIMTTAVQFGREGKFLPLLFGVPLFIMCGFTHSIADAFYFVNSITPEYPLTISIVVLWLFEILGNFVGCNLYRFLCIK
jgi:formate/nitrite transporter FocA (FNT family)